jgi:proteasome assembly chaperone 2
LLAWCVEGDNRDDARALAAACLMVLGQNGKLADPGRIQADNLDTDLREPKAWEGLFGVQEGWSGGAGSNAELYG